MSFNLTNKGQRFSVCLKLVLRYVAAIVNSSISCLSLIQLLSACIGTLMYKHFIKGMFQRIKKCMHNTRSEWVVGLSILLGGLQLWKLQLINGYPYIRQSKISWTDHLRRQGCEKKTHFFPLSFCFLLKTPWYILCFISKDALAASNF